MVINILSPDDLDLGGPEYSAHSAGNSKDSWSCQATSEERSFARSEGLLAFGNAILRKRPRVHFNMGVIDGFYLYRSFLSPCCHAEAVLELVKGSHVEQLQGINPCLC